MSRKTRWGVIVRRQFALLILSLTAFVGSARAFPWRPERLPSIPALSEPGMQGDECNTCHTNGGGTARNPFGRDWERTYPLAEDFDLTAAEAFAPMAKKDSDGDGFTNEEELGVGTHPGDALSRPLRFTKRLRAGLNTLGVPVQPRSGFRALDLLDLLGDAAESLVRWGASDRRFTRITRSTPSFSPDNVIITGQTAFLVPMRESKAISFVGRAWSSGRVALEEGLNFVAVPRRPSLTVRLDQLLDGLGFGIALRDDGLKFQAHLPGFDLDSPSNVPLRGGEGYFIFSPVARTRDFVGSGWTDE